MKKFISALVIMILMISISNVYAADTIDFPDMKNHWAADSVNVLAQKGIIHGWDGKFHPNDQVKTNEYIKMVVTALGYTDIQNYPGDWARNYIEKASELGLILPGEIQDYAEPINRGMMAKIAMRALKDESVPDYIMAYKGLVTDYEDIDPSFKMDALKCIEKGIIKGMPDGAFRPSYYSTRAEAATVIHRMISQEERDKAKPIFATPDKEFETFMASPEARDYCSVDYIHKVVDGKVIFGGIYQDKTGEVLARTWFNPTVNKEVYELLRNLVNISRKYGYYVRVFMSTNGDVVWFKVYENKLFGEYNQFIHGTNISIILYTKDGKHKLNQQDSSYYLWALLSLVAEKETFEDYAAVNFKDQGMLEVLEKAFKTIYGESLGGRLYTYAVSEYDKETSAIQKGEYYYNEEIGIRSDLDGLEVANDNGYGYSILFSTNKIK